MADLRMDLKEILPSLPPRLGRVAKAVMIHGCPAVPPAHWASIAATFFSRDEGHPLHPGGRRIRRRRNPRSNRNKSAGHAEVSLRRAM